MQGPCYITPDPCGPPIGLALWLSKSAAASGTIQTTISGAGCMCCPAQPYVSPMSPTACRGHRWCACLSAPPLNALPAAVSRSPAPTPYAQTPPGPPPACRPRHGRCSSDSIPPQRPHRAPRPDNACDGRPPQPPHQSPPATDCCGTAHPPPPVTASPQHSHHRTPPTRRRRRRRPPYSSPPRGRGRLAVGGSGSGGGGVGR